MKSETQEGKVKVPPFDKLLRAPAQRTRPWKVDGEKFRGGRNCIFPSPLFFKGKKGPEDEGLVRISF